MDGANGTLTPPVPEPAPVQEDRTPNKRKREEEDQVTKEEIDERNAQTQRDILEILQQHDTSPSFLTHPLDRPSKDERSPKKARLSEPADEKSSISSKLAAGAYSNLADLRKDAVVVSEGLVASVRAEAKERENSRLQVDDLKQIQRTQAFEQVVKDVVEQESQYEAVHGSKVIKQEDDTMTNGVATEKAHAGAGGAGAVLTLFGNAPTPKQLFSSMQRPGTGASDRAIKTELPVEEMSLPNGLSATKIMPVSADSKKGPTFEDSFAPAYNLPALNPPKAHKRSTTRDTTITWEFKDQTSRNKKGGYTVQSLSVGDWLGYGGVESKEEPTSPREKRKQRDRALSGGESSQPPPSRESLEDTLIKEEEALFRRAYSSFAPSYDNSKSVVPQETKNMVWWNKVGRKRYDDTFAVDPALLDERPEVPAEVLPEIKEVKIKDEDFGKILEQLDELEEDATDAKVERDYTDVDQTLRQVSELLETLASHQRIRNASLGSSSSVVRTPISPAPTLASRIGRPDSPAQDEVSTYHSLRRELAYLMLKLPPYAVAKLDGDQLAELGVSKLITFQGDNTKGTMEEDQVARLAKYTAMATAAGIATLTRPGSQSGQHYSSSNQRPAIGQAANTRYGQSAQYGASRTPVQPQFQRSASNQSSYGTPSATAPRPGYGQQPNQYTRPQAYGQTNGQQQYYRPQQTPGSYGGYNQQYGASTPQTQQRPSFSSSQPLAQYQQRAVNAVAYQTNPQQQQASQPNQNQSPFTQRTASPLKPAPAAPGYPPQASPGPVQRPQYAQAGSGRNTPANNYPSQPQTPVNGFGQRPVAPAPRAASGTPQPQNIQPAPPQVQSGQTNGHATPFTHRHGPVHGSHTLSNSSNGPSNLLICPFGCTKTFQTQWYLTRHIKSHTGEKNFHCPREGCTSKFGERFGLTRHLRDAHDRPTDKNDSGPVVRVCETCGREFYPESRFREHLRSHSGERPFVCEVEGCGKRFLVKGNFNRHLRELHPDFVSSGDGGEFDDDEGGGDGQEGGEDSEVPALSL